MAKSDIYISNGSSQSKEMDLYKQKLDFVHVVSHEVRNPLTVIKAYATILAKEALSTSDIDKRNALRQDNDIYQN